jgi:hypothetical protein
MIAGFPIFSHQFYDLFNQQSTIGWDQIIYGRFSTLWNTTQLSISTKVPLTWLTYIIRTIWHHSYEIWKHRCTTNTGSTPQDKRQRELLRLTPKIKHLYNQINTISPSDIDVIYNHTYEELLLLPTSTIEKWIYKAEMRIKASIRRQIQHDKLTNHTIKKFFHRVITTTIPTRYIPIHTSPPPPTETTPIINQISQTALTFLSTCFTYQDPHIPIPKSDYRPP